jgi:hypothetical protein
MEKHATADIPDDEPSVYSTELWERLKARPKGVSNMSMLRHTILAVTVSSLVGVGAIAATGATASSTLLTVYPCTAVKASVGTGEGTAGSVYYPIRLKNTSGVTCTLRGYPVVSFTNKYHDPLGGQAAEDIRPHSTVTLVPNASAHSTVRVPDADNFAPSTCLPRTSTYLRVRTKMAPVATFVPLATTVCTTTAGQSFVLPIHR